MKTHYLEVDYREDWIRDIFLSLNHGFSSINQKINTIGWYDGCFAQEQAESIFGIAFITAQTYIVGTISDISKISGQDSKSNKTEWLSVGSPIVDNNITKIFLINTIANYYKHHEEWENRDINHHNKNTIDTLSKCSITEKTEFPCHEIATKVCPTEVLCELDFLLDIMTEWRKFLLSYVKDRK